MDDEKNDMPNCQFPRTKLAHHHHGTIAHLAVADSNYNQDELDAWELRIPRATSIHLTRSQGLTAIEGKTSLQTITMNNSWSILMITRQNP
jgi:hypothetical protein